MGASWWSLISVAVIALLVQVVWSIRRHRDPKLNIDSDSPIEKLDPSLAGITHGTAEHGNSVELFENGTFFDAIFERIAGARQTVHFETFLCKDGALGRRMAAAFLD